MMAARLAGGQLHLQHGPIDLVLRCWGDPRDIAAAEHAAVARFRTILDELVAELPVLRSSVSEATPVEGKVARRMLAACRPFAARGVFVTAMAAVAGAVADEIMATMRAATPGLRKAFVNDGGDIAVFAGPGEVLSVGMIADPDAARPRFYPRPDPPPQAEDGVARAGHDGALVLTHGDGIGGIATSGRHGRSFSLGIADAVTVVARDAATADAAATLIANAVDIGSTAVTRRAARELDPDSDLGDVPVTVAVGALASDEIAAALEAGAARAEAWRCEGLIIGAALRLRGEARIVGVHPHALEAA